LHVAKYPFLKTLERTYNNTQGTVWYIAQKKKEVGSVGLFVISTICSSNLFRKIFEKKNSVRLRRKVSYKY